jgi:hypothetical protein
MPLLTPFGSRSDADVLVENVSLHCPVNGL